MARLRKPSPNESTIFMPPSTRATRSSPRKITRSTQYTESSDDESVILVPKQSKRDLRYTNASSQDAEDSFLAPKSIMASDALTPRKQRILRPVESNSRLLKKMSNESLASPEKRRRERRIRSGTTDIDVGKKTSLLYAKTLARSVVKKQANRAQIEVVEEPIFKEARRPSAEDLAEEVLEAEEEVEAETSLWCGDEDDVSQEKEAAPVAESSDDEDDDSIVDTRRRRQRPQRRLAEPESDEESEDSLQEAKTRKPSITQSPQQEVSAEEPQPLTSVRPPYRKGHSTISNWAQEVIDLTSSPDAPSSFVAPPLSPPTRTRTASFASSRPQTSSSHDGLAILNYSPTPTKNRSPCKAPPLSRPVTPPLAPPSPSKLVSPSKKKPIIPKAPDLRPSLDAFWNPEVVNDWNEKHSPSKPLVSPRKQKWRDDIVKMMEGIALSDDGSDENEETPPSPTTSPRKKVGAPRSTSKKPILAPTISDPSIKEIRAQRKAFSEQKHAIASSFLTELDSTIAKGQISSLSKQTGGIKLIWSRTLKTTAGRANWRREQIRIRTGPLPTDYTTEIRHHCSIELAEKVIDDEERLYNVLAHEYCHLTTFMISNVRNNPHGAEFKSWGRKVSDAFREKGVEVTTKHSYAIEFKYVWECISCSYEFKRHSKSIDTQRHSCGKCKGRLVQTKPVPRQTAIGQDGKKEKSEYQIFVKGNFARVKKEMESRGEDAKMGKVMENVAREYREMKAKKDGGRGLEEALEGLKI
jgi:predicted SprT family Zn-dependent metalloprotease